MAERSFLWTTNNTGDGTGTGYTQTDASNIFEITAQCFGRNGVAPNYLNELSAFGSTNNARIDTGAAMVDGKPYKNDAYVNVSIPSAVGGGNTRIDRIVLRCSWSAQTVRVTRIAGTDAASPTAPLISQNSGTVYDIRICQARVDTVGTVTITDERDMAQVDTGEIAENAVDDTRVGNKVPQFYRRQGGSSTDWSSNGTATYTPGYVRMQAGASSITISTGTSNNLSITFPVAFSNIPLVLVGLITNSSSQIWNIGATSVTATGFTARATRTATTGTDIVGFNWLAIGQE